MTMYLQFILVCARAYLHAFIRALISLYLRKMIILSRLFSSYLCLIDQPYNASNTIGWQVVTLVGSSAGSVDGTGSSALFNSPQGVSIDASGNAYITEYKNYRVRKVSSTAVTTTLAGSGVLASIDGLGTTASFCQLYRNFLSPSGTLYVSEFGKGRVRTVSSSGLVSTLAGQGTSGWADGTGSSAVFFEPAGMWVDSAGTAYVSESSNNRIRRVTSVGVVTTVAGSGVASWVDSIGSTAGFNRPVGLCGDTNGNLFVADTDNHVIRKISPMGFVSTLAGSVSAVSGADGFGTTASFKSPKDVKIDTNGNLFVTDNSGNCIRMVSRAGLVTTIAGSGIGMWSDGVGTAAGFQSPFGLGLDSSGTLFVTEMYRIRVIYPRGMFHFCCYRAIIFVSRRVCDFLCVSRYFLK